MFRRLACILLAALLHLPLLAGAAPAAREGLLDLTDWDFETDGVVNLRGEYEFYWQALYDRIDLLTKTPDTYTYVPGPWDDTLIDGKAIGGEGYATYRLNILLPRKERLALKFLDFGTSYRVYIDEERILEAGQPGRFERETIGRYAPQLIEFEPEHTRIELIFNIANFDHRSGGAWEPVILGNPKQVHRLRENAIAKDLLLVGSMMMIGLYNFAIFLLRRDNRASLFLGLICVSAGIRLLSVDERYGYLLFPGITWELFSKIEYASWYLLLPAFGHFIYHAFPRQMNFKIMYLMDTATVVAVLVVLATSLRVFSHTVPAMMAVHLAALTYGAFCLASAWRDQQEGAAILIVGYLMLFGTAVHDMLVNTWQIEGDTIVGVGIVAFIICQSLVVIYRFATTLTTVEQQHEELLSTNLKLQMQEKLRLEAENESRTATLRFRESQQFEAIGVLAHDVVANLKNSFTRAADDAVKVARTSNDNPELVASMEEVRDTAHRGIGVIEDVLSLSRLRDQVTQVDINHVINEYLDSPTLMALGEESGIVFERSLAQGIGHLVGSRLHIRRILENLVSNATDSQPNGGRIRIATEEVMMDEAQLFYDEIAPGNYIVLSVEDDGIGIPNEDLDLVFQPFFSRSDVQSTVGLGMAVVSAIVRQHRGGIDVISSANEGTRFEVYLPLSRS